MERQLSQISSTQDYFYFEPRLECFSVQLAPGIKATAKMQESCGLGRTCQLRCLMPTASDVNISRAVSPGFSEAGIHNTRMPSNQIASLERVIANFSTQKLNVPWLCTLTSCSFYPGPNRSAAKSRRAAGAAPSFGAPASRKCGASTA